MKDGRNAPCACGSGRKFKLCCGRTPAGGPTPEAQQHLVALFRAGLFPELERQAAALVARWPGHGPSWNFLGVAQLAQARDAFEALGRAASLLPGDPTAQNNFGHALKDRGRLLEAADCFARSIALRPDNPRAHLNLGAVLKDLGRLGESAECSRRALALQPDYPEALTNLGMVLRLQGRPGEAEDIFRRALAVKPDFVAARMGLAMSLCDQGDMRGAEQGLREALAQTPDSLEARSALLFVLNYQPGRAAAELLEEARLFGQVASRQARPFAAWSGTPEAGRRLKVGFVSGDFCQHPVGQFIEHVLAALGNAHAGRLELHAYHAQHYTDGLTERLKALFKGWRMVAGMSDAALAEQIHRDGIDILIDLSGHTSYNRLPVFAWRPAPVQMTWLGYLATTGVPGMDYLLADEQVLPVAAEAAFTECIVRMPKSYVCFTPPRDEAPVVALPALAQGGVTFGSFNNLSKLNDEVLALWARILIAVPSSRLLLKARQLADEAVRGRLTGFFEARGVAADRLLLLGHVPRDAHLAIYGQVDIGLDPFPYPGITTTVEALWMGVPVVSLVGTTFMARQGVGLLTHVGLEDWLADSAEAYLATAVRQAAEIEALARLRGELRARLQASPVFDQHAFARDFEAMLRKVWRIRCDAQVAG